jgi:hypothetical protein
MQGQTIGPKPRQLLRAFSDSRAAFGRWEALRREVPLPWFPASPVLVSTRTGIATRLREGHLSPPHHLMSACPGA